MDAGPGNDRIGSGALNYAGPGKDVVSYRDCSPTEVHGGPGDTGNDFLDGGGEQRDSDRCGGGGGTNTYVKCERRIPGEDET